MAVTRFSPILPGCCSPFFVACNRARSRPYHGIAEEGTPLGWRCATIRLGTWQDRQLSVSGFADAGIARGAGDGGASAISAGDLDG